MTTIYDLYEQGPWRKVAEISEDELIHEPGMMYVQVILLGRVIVPQKSKEIIYDDES